MDNNRKRRNTKRKLKVYEKERDQRDGQMRNKKIRMLEKRK